MWLIIANFLILSIAMYLKIKNKSYLDQILELETLKPYMDELYAENTKYKIRLAELNILLEKSKQSEAETRKLFDSLQSELLNRFKSVSYDVIAKNNSDFLKLADYTFSSKEKNIETAIKSIKEALERFDNKVVSFEKSRENIYSSLSEQLQSLSREQKDLQQATSGLAKALTSPNVRGHWGEAHLRRLLEISGMLNHVDFVEQNRLELDDGKTLKPDVIVHMPCGHTIIIDVKTPIMDSDQDTGHSDKGNVHAKEFAKKVREHIIALSKKQYQKYLISAPDFVIMFMPSESLFSTALSEDPGIIEVAANKNVMIATPATLLSMLSIIASSWKSDNISKNFEYIVGIGREICGQLASLEISLGKIGKQLQLSSSLYHNVMAELEGGIFSNSQKFLASVDKPHVEQIPLEVEENVISCI